MSKHTHIFECVGCNVVWDGDGHSHADYQPLHDQCPDCGRATEPLGSKHLVDCVNACKGINPEAVPELIEALDGLLRCKCDRAGHAGFGPYKCIHVIKARAALEKAKEV